MMPPDIATLKAADAIAREQAIDPTRSFILEAPAGSGKTSVLVQRFLAALAVVPRPERVLAITFTRKAAGEMQARIFEALKSADGPEPQEGFRKTTHRLARAVIQRSDQKNWNLLEHPARLQIYTIDALCRRIAQSAPLTSGLGAIPDATDNLQALIEEALDHLVATMRSPQETNSAIGDMQERSFRALLDHVAGNLHTLRRLIAQMLLTRDQWEDVLVPTFARQDFDRLEAALERLSVEMAMALVEMTAPVVEAARAALHQAGAAPYLPLPEELLANIDRGSKTNAHWKRGELRGVAPSHITSPVDRPGKETIAQARAIRALSDWLLTGDPGKSAAGRGIRKKADHNMRFPINDAIQKMPDVLRNRTGWTQVLEKLARTAGADSALYAAAGLPDPILTPDQQTLLLAMVDVLTAATAHLHAVFNRRNLCDFGEIAMRARKALGPDWQLTETAERFDATFNHILVDEFQDTSHAQVDLLGALTKTWEEPEPGKPAERSLFLVGDPMQSIYLFRQADVSLFLQAWRSHRLNNVALTPLSLTVNFRSDAGIVDFVNRAFKEILPQTDDLVNGAVSNRPAVAHHPPGSDPPIVTNLHGGVAPPDAADDPGHRPQVSLRASAMDVLVQQVRDALSAAGPAHREGDLRSPVAVLVRNRSHAVPILERLRAERIGVTPNDIDRLQHRPHVRDIVSLTRAIANRADSIAWAALLKSPAIGLTYADLVALTGEQAIGPGATTVSGENSLPLSFRVFDPAIQANLSPDGRQRLQRAVPLLQKALDQWERRPAHLLIEGAWIALGFPGAYPNVPTEVLFTDFEVVLEEIQKVEAEGRVFGNGALEQRLENAKSPAMPEAPDRVTISTIHASKGLEWDTVIIPAIDSAPRRESKPLIFLEKVTSANGRHTVFCPSQARGDTGLAPLAGFLRRLRNARLEAEARRLLYVGVTRARKRLVLLADSPEPKHRTFFHYLQHIEDVAPAPPAPLPPAPLLKPPSAATPALPPGVLPSMARPWPVAPTKQELLMLEAGIDPAKEPFPPRLDKAKFSYDQPTVWKRLETYRRESETWIKLQDGDRRARRYGSGLALRHLADDWASPPIPEFPAVPNLLARQPDSPRERLERIRSGVGSGRTLLYGRVYHRAMEAIASRISGGTESRSGSRSMPPDEDVLRGIVRRAMRIEGLNPSSPPHSSGANQFHQVLGLVQESLRDARLARLLLLPGQSEIAVEGLIDGYYTAARADRVAYDPQTGTLHIVDFKITAHQGGQLEDFLREKAAKYARQLERYARFAPAMTEVTAGARPRAVLLALFFPVQFRWFEWAPGDRPRLLPPL